MRSREYVAGLMVVLVSVICLCVAGCVTEKVFKDSEKANKSPESSKGDYTWMTINLPWRGVVSLPFINSEQEKESEASVIRLTDKSDFTIYAALGSGEFRVYNVVAVRSDGRVIAAYKDRNSYRYFQKKFVVGSQKIAGLRRVLIKNGAGDMPASVISADNKGEGVQGGFTIRSGSEVRRSYFSDSWPNEFQNIVDYINNEILRYNPDGADNGFDEVDKSIINVDPEATLAIRGLINGK